MVNWLYLLMISKDSLESKKNDLKLKRRQNCSTFETYKPTLFVVELEKDNSRFKPVCVYHSYENVVTLIQLLNLFVPYYVN